MNKYDLLTDEKIKKLLDEAASSACPLWKVKEIKSILAKHYEAKAYFEKQKIIDRKINR
jgi:hypothetical protein